MHLLEPTLIAGAPLLLAVLGELLLQRAGVINIGLEGMMLGGAFGGAFAAAATGSVMIGFAGGIVGAAIPGILFGWLTLFRAADQIVTGVAINLLALGATSVLYREWNRDNSLTGSLPSLPRFEIAGLALDPVTLAAWLMAPAVIAVVLWRSRAGLRMRAAGENPDAIAFGGLSVRGYRSAALSFEIVLAGLAGAYLSLALASGFAENMVSGRGYIALSIVIFARWRVAGALAGVALFSFATALQYAVQAAGLGIAFHLLLGFPYAITLLILIAVPGRVQAPGALGKPYRGG